ncbi:hypothetical protein C8R43DRAFT_837517, partial [Mycena crocata]
AIFYRKWSTKFWWVKSHEGHHQNERADEIVDVGAKKVDTDEIDLTIPPTLNVTRAKLAAMTQSLAYKAIR